MKKRSAHLTKIINQANMMFENSMDDQREGRKFLHVFVSGLLHEDKTYKGFNYLPSAEVENPCTPQMKIKDDSRIKMH